MIANLQSSGENRGGLTPERRWLAVFVLILAIYSLFPALRDRDVNPPREAPGGPASRPHATAAPDVAAPSGGIPTSGNTAPQVEAPQRPTSPATASPTPTVPPTSTSPLAQPALGVLEDIGGGKLRSTAGLIYKPLRSEHRLDHVLRHGHDDPSRPVHGVFQGDRATILAVIDEAWQTAQTRGPPQVKREEQGPRTALVVDLGRTIGYLGGEAGQRRNHPPCRHVQLVVEGNEIVTAYPVLPR